MNKEKLPGTTTSLIMGIIAIVSALSCCCSPVGLLMSIIGLVSANKTERTYQQNPDAYYGIENVRTGKVLSIIGLVLSILSIIPLILYFGVIIAAIGSGGGFEEILQNID